MVVELHVVEIDEVAHCLVDCGIGSVLVVFLAEVRGLRSMSDDVAGQQLSQLGGESYEPFLAKACLHRWVVLPINIHAIEVVLLHIISQLDRAGDRVDV